MDSDISSEDETLQIQALAVENGRTRDSISRGTEPAFDINAVPTTGSDYLRKVRLEAKDCPRVVVAELNKNMFIENQTVNIQSGGSVHPASRGFGPSPEWQRLQVAQFSSLRQGLARHTAIMKKNKKKVMSDVIRNLPTSTDVQGWCHLCFGKLKVPRSSELPLIPTVVPTPTDSNGSVPTPTDSNGSVDMEVVCEDFTSDSVSRPSGIGPLLSVVTAMDQQTVIKVLEYHINWFLATGFTEHQGQWFYALLACLEKPLEPDACSLLRSLARAAASLRATLESPSDYKLAPLNLLVCLVSLYFDQKDLMDRSS